MNYYIVLADLFKIQEIHAGLYNKGNKEWLKLKFFHTLQVVKQGEKIIEMTPELSRLTAQQKNSMTNALLMHDYGRAFERNTDGSVRKGFFHGPAGMHLIKTQYEMNDTAVLAAVMVHDQMDEALLELPADELMCFERFLKLPKAVQNSVMEVNKRYALMNEEQKKFIKQVCFLVKDADTYTNIKDYAVAVPITKEKIDPAVSPRVLEAVLNKRYTINSDVCTLPDKVLSFFSWIHYFRFDATMRLVRQENLGVKMRDYVLEKLKEQNFPSNRIDACAKKINQALEVLGLNEGA